MIKYPSNPIHFHAGSGKVLLRRILIGPRLFANENQVSKGEARSNVSQKSGNDFRSSLTMPRVLTLSRELHLSKSVNAGVKTHLGKNQCLN